DRSARVVSCDAGDFGPFQRLPARPRAASAADSPRRGRDPRRLPFQAALPEALRRPPDAALRLLPRQAARRSAPPPSPRARSPARIDKAFSWENPLSAHGLMHMVIPNAHAGDPYRIDTLMLYMANMAWNSSMNTAQVMEMLTDRDKTGEYRIPRIIYSDAYAS